MAAPTRRPRVLIAHDGSEPARRALDRVARLMKEVDVSVVTVAPPIYRDIPYTGYADPGDEEKQRRALDEAKETLAAAGIEARALAPVGDAADEILRAARELPADILVFGARAANPLERLVLGSVSTKVLHDAPCDVLVVR